MRTAFAAEMRVRENFRGLCLVAVLLGVAAAPASPVLADKVRNHFDADSLMRPPGFFDLLVLGAPGPARWLILTDLNPPSAPNRLVQVEAKRPMDSIAAAIRRNHSFQDGTVATFVKQNAGREGLILRMKDEKNFLVLLVDASGEAALWSYVDGSKTEIGHGKAVIARPWEKFSVTAAGPQLSILFNDQKLFDATDPRPVAGRAGLAAAGPGEASFDEFVLEYEAPAGGKP